MPRETRRRSPKRAGATSESSSTPTARGVWSGTLSFGLVTVPVELYTAQRPGSALRMLSSAGSPLERRYVCPREKRPLERDEIVRGYEVERGRFVVIDDAELAALAPRRSRDIEIERFVPRAQLDPAFFIRAYFMLPAGEQTKAYTVLAAAMEDSGRAAIAHFVMRERAYAVAVVAEAGLLRAGTLRFADEVRSAREAGLVGSAKPESARVKKMSRAIEAKSQPSLDEAELRDPEPERLHALALRKLARGEDVLARPEAAPAERDEAGGGVIDLKELLERRLRARKAPKRRKPRKATRKTR